MVTCTAVGCELESILLRIDEEINNTVVVIRMGYIFRTTYPYKAT